MNKDLELAAEISGEIELIFNSVMATVLDYFEEASKE